MNYFSVTENSQQILLITFVLTSFFVIWLFQKRTIRRPVFANGNDLNNRVKALEEEITLLHEELHQFNFPYPIIPSKHTRLDLEEHAQNQLKIRYKGTLQGVGIKSIEQDSVVVNININNRQVDDTEKIVNPLHSSLVRIIQSENPNYAFVYRFTRCVGGFPPGKYNIVSTHTLRAEEKLKEV
jgi:hypothetical protein